MEDDFMGAFVQPFRWSSTMAQIRSGPPLPWLVLTQQAAAFILLFPLKLYLNRFNR